MKVSGIVCLRYDLLTIGPLVHLGNDSVLSVSGRMRLNLATLTVKLCCPMLPLHIVYAPDMLPSSRLPFGGNTFRGHTLWYVNTSPGGIMGWVDMMPAPRTTFKRIIRNIKRMGHFNNKLRRTGKETNK